MALILALLLSAAPVTAADAPTASGAAITTTAVAVAAAETPKIEPSDGFWEYWGHGKGATRSEIFRNFGLALIAFFGLCFGIWRAWTAHRQAIVAEQGLITDRFSTAVDQLGNNQLPVRLGGIYALWRLTEDAPKRDVARVVDILCAFVRSPPPESSGLRDPGPNNAGTDPEEGASVATTPLRPDVQTILDLIAQESAEYRRRLTTQYILDLKRANLVDANLARASLMGADLTDANLSSAELRDSEGLSQPQLDIACVAKGGQLPTLPEGLNPPTNVCPED